MMLSVDVVSGDREFFNSRNNGFVFLCDVERVAVVVRGSAGDGGGANDNKLLMLFTAFVLRL